MDKISLTIELNQLGQFMYRSNKPMDNYQRWEFLMQAANAQMRQILLAKEDKRILTPTGTV